MLFTYLIIIQILESTLHNKFEAYFLFSDYYINPIFINVLETIIITKIISVTELSR